MKVCKRSHDWDNDRYRQCNHCQQISNTKSRKKWRANNLEKARAYAREWAQNNPEKTKQSRLKYRYSLEQQDYLSLQNEQNQCCAVCKTKTVLFIDHSHSTKKVRGLLCRDCNLMLGFARDIPDLLRAGADYLEEKE